jgi:hypothetical protein
MNRIAALFVCALLTACGGGDPTNPGGGGGGVTNFTAKIDGVDWAPDFSPSAVNAAAGLYSITGFKALGSNNYTMVLGLSNITGPGTYPIGVTPQVFGGSGQLSQPPGSGWTTPLDGQAGEIVITTLTPTRLVATFEFVATPLMGTSVNKTVTEGQFDIAVTGTAGLALANQGSSFTGSLGTQSYIGATAASILTTGPNPILTITTTSVGTNSSRTITISLVDMTAAAPYTLSATAPIRSIQVGDGLGMVWTSSTTGGSGMVTISTITAQRIIGSFTATVVGVAGGATGPLTISGNFSMGRII